METVLFNILAATSVRLSSASASVLLLNVGLERGSGSAYNGSGVGSARWAATSGSLAKETPVPRARRITPVAKNKI